MAVSLSKRTARHAACDHDDYRLSGWPLYCGQCADPVTLAYWPTEESDVIIRLTDGKLTSHRSGLVTA